MASNGSEWKICLSGSIENNIEGDSKEIDKLVLSAKQGKWDDVWSIIGTPEKPKKAYLINCIPDNRRWGILHQAVYWNNPNILRKLLKFSACDSGLKAKECTSEVGPTSGMTAREIAHAYSYNAMETILAQHAYTFFDDDDDDELGTYQPLHVDFLKRQEGLIPITLVAYKKTFHPKQIDPEKSIVSVLQNIFNDLNTSQNMWKDVRDKVSDSLYVVDKRSASKIKTATSRQGFFKEIINVYTEESTLLYTHVNTALRRQKETNYKPSAHDLAMGPYVMMYQMLLLYWQELKHENATTYRRMLVGEEDLNKYQVGVSFTWISFISSSARIDRAQAFPSYGPDGIYFITFNIDNTKCSEWQPRNVEAFAQYHESERVYPAGAKFKVTHRRQDDLGVRVALKLIS